MALASHYLLEACFCRPGEGHDEGGVESRGKAVRQQALVPIPVGATLAVINTALLAGMDARMEITRDAAGQTISARFAEEQRQFRPAPTPFVPEATTFVTVSPRALVRLEGAFYSVPGRWAGLDLIVHIGATTVTIVGCEGTRILHPRKRFGERSIDYRHYLSELARKPQAVRQVLPDLLRDLGDPFPAIWDQLHAAHGPRAAARLFAKVPGHLVRRFDRVASIERFDPFERFAELSPCLLETEVLPRNSLDDRRYTVVVRHEHTVDREHPKRRAAKLPQRTCRAFDVSSLRIFAILLGGLNQPRECR